MSSHSRCKIQIAGWGRFDPENFLLAVNVVARSFVACCNKSRFLITKFAAGKSPTTPRKALETAYQRFGFSKASHLICYLAIEK